MPDFLQAQADSNIPSFKVKVTSEWTKAFPIMGMDDDTLSSEARQKIAEQMQAQHTKVVQWFYNASDSRKRKTKPGAHIKIDPGNSTRAPQKIEIFEKLCDGAAIIQKELSEEIAQLSANGEVIDNRVQMEKRNAIRKAALANADDSTRAKVNLLYNEQILEHRSKKKQKSSTDATSLEPLHGKARAKFLKNIPTACQEFGDTISSLGSATTLTLVSARCPQNNGHVRTWGHVVGKNMAGLNFSQAYAGYHQHVVQAFAQFAADILPPIPAADLIKKDENDSVQDVDGDCSMTAESSSAPTTPTTVNSSDVALSKPPGEAALTALPPSSGSHDKIALPSRSSDSPSMPRVVDPLTAFSSLSHEASICGAEIASARLPSNSSGSASTTITEGAGLMGTGGLPGVQSQAIVNTSITGEYPGVVSAFGAQNFPASTSLPMSPSSLSSQSQFGSQYALTNDFSAFAPNTYGLPSSALDDQLLWADGTLNSLNHNMMNLFMDADLGPNMMLFNDNASWNTNLFSGIDIAGLAPRSPGLLSLPSLLQQSDSTISSFRGSSLEGSLPISSSSSVQSLSPVPDPSIGISLPELSIEGTSTSIARITGPAPNLTYENPLGATPAAIAPSSDPRSSIRKAGTKSAAAIDPAAKPRSSIASTVVLSTGNLNTSLEDSTANITGFSLAALESFQPSADASTMLPPEFTFEQMTAGYQGILDTGLSSSVRPVSKVLSPVVPPAVITPPAVTPPAVTPPAVTSPTVPPPATPSAPPLAEPKKKRGGQKGKKAKAQNTVTKQKIAPENVRVALEDTIGPDERTQKRSRSFSKSEDIDVLNKRLKSDSVQPQVDQCSTATSASAGVTTTRSGRTTVAPRRYVEE
ncbi:hypothetical protein EV359DRAFT_80195 [Lentinula novae-zelandiae]|nr:hypothetical protein EV359DRAFT_80195 [Lentinula novae-zelandiae]